MRTLYRIIDVDTNKNLLIDVTEDIDKFMENFRTGHYPERHLARYKYKDRLKVIVEKTDDIEGTYASYKWPQLSRVEYDRKLVDRSLELRITRRVNNAVNWLIENFTDFRYSFRLFLNDDGFIKADIYENGKLLEEYVFKASGTPNVRTCFGGK
jgi:hypothetical protein